MTLGGCVSGFLPVNESEVVEINESEEVEGGGLVSMTGVVVGIVDEDDFITKMFDWVGGLFD